VQGGRTISLATWRAVVLYSEKKRYKRGNKRQKKRFKEALMHTLVVARLSVGESEDRVELGARGKNHLACDLRGSSSVFEEEAVKEETKKEAQKKLLCTRWW
jgi:hypothetical protein